MVRNPLHGVERTASTTSAGLGEETCRIRYMELKVARNELRTLPRYIRIRYMELKDLLPPNHALVERGLRNPLHGVESFTKVLLAMAVVSLLSTPCNGFRTMGALVTVYCLNPLHGVESAVVRLSWC